MAILLDVYSEMQKEAEEAEQTKLVNERVEVLDKYAALATELLHAEYPNDFTQDDIVALADKLIQRDLAIEDQNEKTAEAKQLVTEYVKVAEQMLQQEHGKEYTPQTVELLADKLMELDAKDMFEKEAETVTQIAFLDELNKTVGTDFKSIDEFEEMIKSSGVSAEAGKGIWETIKGLGSKAKDVVKIEGERAPARMGNSMWRHAIDAGTIVLDSRKKND